MLICMSNSHATNSGRHRLCQVWLPSPCGCVQMPGVLMGGQAGGLWWYHLCGMAHSHGPLSLVSRPLPLGPAALAATPEPSWVCSRYSVVSQLLGPWNVCFRLLSIWGFMSLSCCNLDYRTCDPIMASLSSSTPIADLASVQPHWAWCSRTWATSWGSSRLQAASPLGGPCLSRNYGWRGPRALCCLVSDVLRG